MTLLLETRALCKRFGGLVATDNVNFSIAKGARHALIGPNGAGKTTFINLLTGNLKPSSGKILLNGEDISNASSAERVKRGIARTFQINQLCMDMTPVQMIAMTVSERLNIGANIITRLDLNEPVIAEAADILAHFQFMDLLNRRIGTLPYGKQRQLEIAAAFALKPSMLLLDEPAAGVPERERQDLLDTIAALPADTSVLLIEHDMDIVFKFANRMTVLVNGTILAEGAPADIGADPRVREAYLGSFAHG